MRLRARGRACCLRLRGGARVAQLMRAVASPSDHHPPPQRTAGASKRHLRAPSSQPLVGASRAPRHSCVFVRVGEPAASISEAELVLLSSHELQPRHLGIIRPLYAPQVHRSASSAPSRQALSAAVIEPRRSRGSHCCTRQCDSHLFTSTPQRRNRLYSASASYRPCAVGGF